jgi:selenocysteine lyase/cysteine desulfurase
MPLDLEQCRAEFPVTQSCIYMNHAAVAPVSRRVRKAMVGLLEDVHHFGSAHWDRWVDAYAATRRAVAQLLGAEPAEIAFVKNTSEGISLFTNGLDWQRGDEVVSLEGEFPANYYPWQLLETKGVALRLVKNEYGRFSLDAIAQALGPRTRVVAVSFVQYLSGFRLDLNALGGLCAAHNALLFVDAIQGLGVFPLDVRRAHIAGLAADGHKWLTGPEGAGLLFIRKDLIDSIQPTTIGWMNFRRWMDFTSRDLTWRDDARRYEPGSLNTVGIYGLGAALNLLLEIGVENIAERVLDLTDRLRAGLKRQGHRVFGPDLRAECSGIVSFVPRSQTAEQVANLLREEGIIVSARCGMVRVSPHFYNSEAEIDCLLECLP